MEILQWSPWISTFVEKVSFQYLHLMLFWDEEEDGDRDEDDVEIQNGDNEY